MAAEDNNPAPSQDDTADYVAHLGEMGGYESPAARSPEPQGAPEPVDYSAFEGMGLSEDQLRSVPSEVLDKLSEAFGLQQVSAPGFPPGFPMPGMMPGQMGMMPPGPQMGYFPQQPTPYPAQQPYGPQQPMEAGYAGPEKFNLTLDESEYGPELRGQLQKLNDHYHQMMVNMEAAIGGFYQQWQQHQQTERTAWVQEKLSSLGDDWRTVFGRGNGSNPWQRHYRNQVASTYQQLLSMPQFGQYDRNQLFEMALQYAVPDQYSKVQRTRSAKASQPTRQSSPRQNRPYQPPTNTQASTRNQHYMNELGTDEDGLREILAAQREMEAANTSGLFSR